MNDNEKIIKRGYTLDDEYIRQGESGKLTKLFFESGGEREGIWVYPLEDDNQNGKDFHFVFHNDPVFTRGPSPIAGLVGIATSHGKSARATALSSRCCELFKKTGEAAILYHNRCSKHYKTTWDELLRSNQKKEEK